MELCLYLSCPPSTMRSERNTYIDHIRVYLTLLVILHHTAITYGGPGGWYYTEKNDSYLTGLVFTLFVATNQAFFMGFFFFLSSFFIPSSWLRKGERLFLLDRLKRLGLPLILYSLVIAPVTIYLMLYFAEGATYSFMDYYLHRDRWVDFGVLWFTAALLLFTLGYWAYKKLPVRKGTVLVPFPTNRQLFFSALALGLISYLVRLIFPVGWTLQPLGFQLGHFPQYVALFIIGIVAYENNWLQYITYRKGIQWFRVALLLVLVGFPFLFAVKEITHRPLSDFQGGFSFTSLISCLWEQTLGVSLIMTFLGIGKYKWNTETPLLTAMARSAYAVYIIHPLVLVSAALLMRNTALTPGFKFLITGILTIAVSFLIGQVLVKTPVVNEVV